MSETNTLKQRAKTYSGYAVKTPAQYSEELVRIRPSKEAPESLAIFESYANAKWFCEHFKLPEICIVPVVIVRTDSYEMVE